MYMAIEYMPQSCTIHRSACLQAEQLCSNLSCYDYLRQTSYLKGIGQWTNILNSRFKHFIRHSSLYIHVLMLRLNRVCTLQYIVILYVGY